MAFALRNPVRTAQTLRFMEAVDAFKEPLRVTGKAIGRLGWIRKPIPPDTPAAIRAAASDLYDLLDIQFEDESAPPRLKKYLRRVKNLRKMVGQYREVADTEELAEVYQAQSSKTKDAWEKIYDYLDEVRALLTTLDWGQEGSFHIGGMRVALIQQGGAAWYERMVDKLHAVLTKTAAYLDERGLSRLTADLTVFAYPTAYLPGRRNVNAYYQPSTDVVAIAAGSAWFKNSTITRMAQTMIHELGHRAYYQIVGDRGMDAWEDFFASMQEPLDVEAMIERWRAWVQESDDPKEQRRRSHFGTWFPELHEEDPEAAQWLQIAVQSLGLNAEEKFDSYRGLPTRTSMPALDELERRRHEVEVFAEPVTAYSTTSPSELFAEVFAHYILYGPRTIAPRVRAEFSRTLPSMIHNPLEPLC